MTVNTELSKRRYDGNGVTTGFDYDFKIPLNSDLSVSLFDPDDIEYAQVLNTHYTMTGAGSDVGGRVTFLVAPPDQWTVLLISNVSYVQPTDFKNQGRFFPETHENALDRNAILARQLKEITDRSMTLPPQVVGVSTQLPVPEANTIFGWNPTSDSIQNFPLSTIASNIAYGDKTYQTFAGTGAQVNFILTRDPASLGNLDISIDGVTQVPGTDYTYLGTTLTFTTAPANNAVILVRYDVAVPVGSALASAVQYTIPTGGITSTQARLDAIYAAAGSALVGFKYAGATGAVTRTVYDLATDHAVSVKSFGATCNGVTDDTAAVQAAVNYVSSLGGGQVKINRGVTKITATVTVPANVWIVGEGESASQVSCTANTSTAFRFTGLRSGIAGVTISYTAPSTGATAVYVDGASDFRFYDLYIHDMDIGIDVRAASIVQGANLLMESYKSCALRARDAALDVHISSFVFNAGTATNGALGGIRLENFVDAFMAVNGDVLNGVYSLVTTSTVYAATQRPGNSAFTSVYFDSAANTGASIANLTATEFVSCWFSGGRSSVGYPGATLGQCDSLTFTNCRFVNCGSHGVAVGSTSKRIRFIGCKADSNGYTAASSAGYQFVDATDWEMLGCVGRNGLYSGNQSVGVSINGTSDRFRIIGGDMQGNTITSIFNAAATTADYAIRDVLGYTPPFTAATFTNSWTNLGAGTQGAEFIKGADGWVTLRGIITGGTVGLSAFTLPAGLRPAANESFAVNSNSLFGAVQVTTAGLVNILSPSTSTWVSLSGIRFKAV